MSFGWQPPSDVGAYGPIEGTGEKHKLGSYICLVVDDKKFRISQGAASVLAAEINGILLQAAINRTEHPTTKESENVSS